MHLLGVNQEGAGLLDSSDQVLVVVDVLTDADQRISSHPDRHDIPYFESRRNDDEINKRQYRCLALFLHPCMNKFPFTYTAFNLVAIAWAALSGPSTKLAYANKLFASWK